MSRCRIPITVQQYKEMQGKIISHEDGLLRKEINDNYVVIEDEFVSNKFIQVEKEGPQSPLIISAVDPSNDKEGFKQWLSTNSGFIEGLTSTVSGGGVSPTVLHFIQKLLIDGDVLKDYQFLWLEKARQFGFSFLLACRALAESMLSLKHTSIFISYNEEESKEKIIFARELYESLPTKYKLMRRLKYDNKTSLVFEKVGENSAETRILSFPQRIIRGKGGGVHVRIDEAAHCIHIRKIYTSALPVLSRGESSLWIGSSPAGKSGLFYEIGSNQDNHYSTFTRVHIYWWMIPEFCVNVKTAMEEAPFMITDERVHKFASKRLKLIRGSMLLEEFQQEYECAYLDESYSYYPWDLIMKCVPITNVDAKDSPDFDAPGDELSDADTAKSGTGIDYYTEFDKFMECVQSGMFQGPFLMGFDVGRTTDASEVCILEEEKETKIQICRCMITMKNKRLPEQRALMKDMVKALEGKLVKVGIDDNGIGRNIAEDLEDFAFELVVRLPFNSNAWKEEAARKFKYRLQANKIILPTNRQLLSQVHSIKRTLLPGGAWRFDAEKNEKHHGDKFWAMVAASEMGFPVMESSDEIQNVDSRLFTKGNNKLPTTRDEIIQKKPMIEIITPEHANAIMKYNPHKGMLCNNVYFNLPSPSIVPIAKIGDSISPDNIHIL